MTRGQAATPSFTQNFLKDGILLTNNLGKLMNFKVKSFPQRAFKDKAGFALPSDWWELVEVADQDELDSTEEAVVAPDGTAHGVQLLKQLGRQHGDFINDENIGCPPAGGGAAILADGFHEDMRRSITEANARPTMKSSSTRM